MSGIGALVWFDGRPDPDQAQIERFKQALRPYGRDRQVAEVSGPCALVHAHCASTSIHDPDAAPAVAGQGRYHVVLDGRLGRRTELLDRLGAPADAAGWCDARLAAESWARWKEKAPEYWCGEFAVVIWDAGERRLWCVRDQLGQRPLSWHRRDDGLVIVATAPKPMFAVEGVPCVVDEQKIADQLVQLFHDGERSFYRNIQRVAAGHFVSFSNGTHASRRYWFIDNVQLRNGPLKGDDIAAEGAELLDAAVADCLRGSSRPAAFITGGLDSSAVAVTALKHLPVNQSLPTFTWVPSRDWDGRSPSGTYGDERPLVEAIAAMHPRLKPHFTSSEGLGLFHLMDDFIDVAGVAPRNAMNFCWLHDISQQAAAQGHDLLLEGTMGNAVLSWSGSGAWLEWLRRGSLLRLVSDMSRYARSPSNLAWRIFNHLLLPSLPAVAAKWLRHARSGFPAWPLWYNYSAINPAYFDKLGMQSRMDSFGWDFNITGTEGIEARRMLLSRGAVAERGDVALGFRVLHGIEARDPFSDLKLVEWCFSLPDESFYLGGKERGLMRHIMRGRLPQQVLDNHLTGLQVVDWHARMNWDMPRIREELSICADDPDLALYMDVERLKSLLAEWPDRAPIGRMRPDTTAAYLPVAMASALAAGRLVRRAKGSNR